MYLFIYLFHHLQEKYKKRKKEDKYSTHLCKVKDWKAKEKTETKKIIVYINKKLYNYRLKQIKKRTLGSWDSKRI